MLNDANGANMNSKLTRGFHFIFYLLIVNVLFDIIITIINVFGVNDYLSQLIAFSVKNIVIFVVVLIVTITLTIIPVVIGQRYNQWSEDKQTRMFFKILTGMSLSSITLASIFVYFVFYPSYNLLMNPFSLNSANSFLLLISPIWWFFSFNLGFILIFLLYIYLES